MLSSLDLKFQPVMVPSLFVSILAGKNEVKAMKEIDAALVRACQCGNIEAFEQIFRIYREPIFRLAYRFTGN